MAKASIELKKDSESLSSLSAALGGIRRENLPCILQIIKHADENQLHEANRLDILIYNFFTERRNIASLVQQDEETQIPQLPYHAPGHQHSTAQAVSTYVRNYREVYKQLKAAMLRCSSLSEIDAVYEEFKDWGSQYYDKVVEETGSSSAFGLSSAPPEIWSSIYELALTRLIKEMAGEDDGTKKLDFYEMGKEIESIKKYLRDSSDYCDYKYEKAVAHINKILMDAFQDAPHDFLRLFDDGRMNSVQGSIHSTMNTLHVPWITGRGGFKTNESMITMMHIILLKSQGIKEAPSLIKIEDLEVEEKISGVTDEIQDNVKKSS